MKKCLWVLILFLIPLKVFGSSSYIVMDADSKRVLEGDNIHLEKLIASTSKIMTSLIAIEYGNLDEVVTVSNEVLKAYGSNVYIELGEEITLRDLVYGLLLRSGNDCAIEIAFKISGGMEEFANLMNKKAKELGMEHTNFINSSGLEDENKNGNTSTAYDMALLMSYAINNDTFVKISGTKRHIVTTNYKTYDWHNKNKLLSNYKYTIAGKTGFTKLARRTLVTSALKDGKKLVIVTLNNPDDFDTHKALYEKNFKKYNQVTFLKAGEIKVDNNPFYDKLYINQDIKVLMTSQEEKNAEINYELDKKEHYETNEVVGNVIIKVDGKVLRKDAIYAKKLDDTNEDGSGKKSFLKRLLDIIFFWKD